MREHGNQARNDRLGVVTRVVGGGMWRKYCAARDPSIVLNGLLPEDAARGSAPRRPSDLLAGLRVARGRLKPCGCRPSTCGLPASRCAMKITDPYSPKIDRSVGVLDDESTTPFCPMVPGTRTIYQARTPDGLQTTTTEVTRDTKTIMGVKTVGRPRHGQCRRHQTAEDTFRLVCPRPRRQCLVFRRGRQGIPGRNCRHDRIVRGRRERRSTRNRHQLRCSLLKVARASVPALAVPPRCSANTWGVQSSRTAGEVLQPDRLTDDRRLVTTGRLGDLRTAQRFRRR